MVLQNIFITFVGKFSNMAKHELTEKQIAALQKLGVANFGFYRAHIPISMNNIYFNTYGKAFDRLSKAIAVDVYTSPIGKNRFRECYDCFKKLNKHGKLGNTEVFLRLLDERAQYYFGILCGTIKSATSIHITPPAASKKTTDVQLTAKQKKQQANAVKAQQRAKAMFESRFHAYTPDSQFQSQYRSTLASHNLIKDDDYEHELSDID